MNKQQRLDHTQKLINHYNHRLEETEQMIASNDFILISNRLNVQKHRFITKLIKLYTTEKYGTI